MYRLAYVIAHASAVTGGVVLAIIAFTMTISICGGAIAKLGYSGWLSTNAAATAQLIQNTGIRTIPGMYEIIKVGIAFVIFAFLPITSFSRAHAVVDLFADYLPRAFNQALITLWELVFFVVLVLITWRLFHGMERVMSANMTSHELGIPEWGGYLVAFLQLLLASLVGAYTAYAQIVKLTTGNDLLATNDGVAH